MITIAIVSFIGSENYGANLQAFALQEKLKYLDYSPIYINYSHPLSLTGVKKMKNQIWSLLRYLFGYGERLRKTKKFRKEFLSLTEKIIDKDKLKSLSKYDYYLVGSDQVWHPNILQASSGYYFLNFLPKGSNKISYASSFGVNKIPRELDKIYFKNLSQFSKISVRETQGADYLKSIGLKSSVVLDPTLLLNKNEWINYFDLKSKVQTPYILCYVVTGDHKGAKFINDLSKAINKTNGSKYKIIIIGDKEYMKLVPSYHLVTNAGPMDFLNYVYNATYVLTNSFHGTCFSLNFNKQFFTVLHRNNPLNSRTMDLLSSVSLSDRIIYADSDINKINILKIDFEPKNMKLNKLREESATYLKELIQ